MWYHYSQNNSGGSFTFDKSAGITHHVLIEAASPTAADERAEEIGLYFDGCETGPDCPCCGDRWYHTSKSSGTKTPSFYGEPVKKGQFQAGMIWMAPDPEGVMHPLQGKFKWLKAISKPQKAVAPKKRVRKG